MIIFQYLADNGVDDGKRSVKRLHQVPLTIQAKVKEVVKPTLGTSKNIIKSLINYN